jgi:hypothetical protein
MNNVELFKKAMTDKVEITAILKLPYRANKITGIPVYFEDSFCTCYLSTEDSIVSFHLKDVAQWIFPKSFVEKLDLNIPAIKEE